jgi:hypothetical protein
MSPKTDKTMVQVSKETRDALHAIGKKGESYDTIIRRLLKRNKGSE